MPDDTTPATKADIRRIDENILRIDGNILRIDGNILRIDDSINRLENSVHEIGKSLQALEKSVQMLGSMLEKGMRNLREADDQILTVLVNMDKRLTGRVDNHEKRIVRLEKVLA